MGQSLKALGAKEDQKSILVGWVLLILITLQVPSFYFLFYVCNCDRLKMTTNYLSFLLSRGGI